MTRPEAERLLAVFLETWPRVWAFWRPIYIATGIFVAFIVLLVLADSVWRLFQ